MEEPVEDEDQDADGDDPDHRLELLPVLGELVEQEDRDQEQQRRCGQAQERSADDRLSQVAPCADQAGGDRRDDQDRLEALAEDDQRGVRDHRGIACAVARGPARLFQRLVEHEARVAHVARSRVVVGDQLGETGRVVGAEPDVALDLLRQRRVERAQEALGAELEERVGGQPGLLGLLALARRDRGLHLVEADVDQVEVRLGARLEPLLRRHLLEAGRGGLVDGLDLILRGDLAALVRGLRDGLELHKGRLDFRGGLGVDSRERRLEVGEGLLRGLGEGDGLLDLEGERDLAVVRAAVVLDRARGRGSG